MFDHLRRIARYIDDSWIGDLLCAGCFFGAFVGLYFFLFAVMP